MKHFLVDQPSYTLIF